MFSTGVDVQSIAFQYVQAERAQQDSIFSARDKAYNNLLKAYTNIKSSVNEFRDLMTDFGDLDKVEAYSVTTSDEGFASITAGANATPGEYKINIEQVAKADQQALTFANETDPMPTSGTMTLGVGADSFTIDMSTLPAGATLSELRDAINSDANNPGVQASIIRTGGSVQLMLSSDETGAANTLSMSTDGSPEMADIQTAMDNKTVISSAQDAIVNMGDTGSLRITSASNKLENVIDGLTIDLDKSHGNTTDQLTFTVKQDNEATKERLQDFVDKFNGVIGQVTSGDKESVISNDGTARMIARQLKSDVGSFNLGQVGISFDRSGNLSLNASKLEEFLEANPDGLTEIFGGTNGVIEKMEGRLNSYVRGDSALINSARDSVQSRLDQLSDRQDSFDRRMESRLEMYISKFSAMQSAIEQLNSTQFMFY